MPEMTRAPLTIAGEDPLTNLLNTLMNVDRKVAFAVKNYTGHKLVSSGLYFQSGTSDCNIPYEIEPGSTLLWGARKSENGFRGSVGNFSYHIQGQQKTLFLMWSVPYDYNLHSNRWNATIVEGYRSANYDSYYNLYHGKCGMPNPHRAGPWVAIDVPPFRLRGSMVDAGKCTLELEIRRKLHLTP